jgi:hypothetical protein
MAAIFAAIFFVLTQNMMAADAAAPQIWFKMTNYNGPQGVDGPQGAKHNRDRKQDGHCARPGHLRFLGQISPPLDHGRDGFGRRLSGEAVPDAAQTKIIRIAAASASQR